MPKSDSSLRPTVNILGTRGIPVGHSGYETFVLRLAPYLVDNGWNVNVYCQLEPDEQGVLQADFEDDWQGIRRIHLGSRRSSSLGSIIFDWRSVLRVLKEPGIDLVLGYNTAIFNTIERLAGRTVLMNMDGVEWRRGKWSRPVQAWFYFNEFVGANTSSVPIADHPGIVTHLQRHGCNRAVMIPYGADEPPNRSSDPLRRLELEANRFFVSIARIEPENSILELVRAFSRKKRGVKLVVLGNMIPGRPFTNALLQAASDEVIFPGPIFDKDIVSALRIHSLAYLHGHQVGGTNPSLVEAMACGSAIVAHDNPFNRWVAGDEQIYFDSEDDLSDIFDHVIRRSAEPSSARQSAYSRYLNNFTWDKVLSEYEALLRASWSARHGGKGTGNTG